ncbi:transposase [Rhodococcus erythropolis]|uniref:transposase n=1 Tax=Rhodococcus erythropolis TaxID=1833 RepID=UPI000AC2930C|nr:transposase [Rhodococcus erythropolis]
MKILDIHRESKGVYGSPRITAELHDGGEIITEKTVAKIMRSLGIVGISPRTFKIRTTVVDPFASFRTTWCNDGSIMAASTPCGLPTSRT